MRFFGLLVAVLYLLIASDGFGQDNSGKTFVSSEYQVPLIELFSSESCSACPEAGAKFKTLRKNKRLWKDFVPVEFHVDYLNHLDHWDIYSQEAFSQRQFQYFDSWNESSAYTPNFVHNGQESNFDVRKLKVSDQLAGILKAEQIDKFTFLLTYQPPIKLKKAPQIFGSLLGNGFVTLVEDGSNAGMTLHHEFVAIDLQEDTMEFKDGSYQKVIKLSPNEEFQPKSLSVAFWVTQSGNLSPIQAVGGDL